MVDMGAIAGAASALKSAYDISKVALGLRDAALLHGKITEMQGEISSALSSAITAQQDQLTMLQTVHALEAKIASFEKLEAEKERYELKPLGWGAMARMLKPTARTTEPPHWACPNCFNDGKIKIIQKQMVVGRGHKWICSGCKGETVAAGEAFAPDGGPKWLDAIAP